MQIFKQFGLLTLKQLRIFMNVAIKIGLLFKTFNI